MTQARPYREKKKMPEVRRGNAGVSDGSAATRGIFLCQNTSIRGMKMGMSFFKQLRREFAGYNGKKLSQDLMAGLTVAAVALPLALAFGVSAGATAACGLVTAIVAGLVISALTGGYYQISGPTGAMATILVTMDCTYVMDLRVES